MTCVFLSSGTGFDEEAALIGAGREFALMKTASGKVDIPLYSYMSLHSYLTESVLQKCLILLHVGAKLFLTCIITALD